MNDEKQQINVQATVADNQQSANRKTAKKDKNLSEIGGRGGLDPSRFGDWEIAGKCVDF